MLVYLCTEEPFEEEKGNQLGLEKSSACMFSILATMDGCMLFSMWATMDGCMRATMDGCMLFSMWATM